MNSTTDLNFNIFSEDKNHRHGVKRKLAVNILLYHETELYTGTGNQMVLKLYTAVFFILMKMRRGQAQLKNNIYISTSLYVSESDKVAVTSNLQQL